MGIGVEKGDFLVREKGVNQESPDRRGEQLRRERRAQERDALNLLHNRQIGARTGQYAGDFDLRPFLISSRRIAQVKLFLGGGQLVAQETVQADRKSVV